MQNHYDVNIAEVFGAYRSQVEQGRGPLFTEYLAGAFCELRQKRRATPRAARLERGGVSIPHRLPVAVEGHHDLLAYGIQRRVPQHVGQHRFLAREVGVDLR